MTFLNVTILIAAAAVAIPVLIHLLNRRRAEMVDWGAMRFLLASLVSRSRRIMIEEIMLMMIRCLLIALIVLAMARPFVPARADIPWALVLPAVIAAALLVGMAAAMWSQRRRRWGLLGAAAALVALAGAATASEQIRQASSWSRGAGQQDVAIVLDGSTSMSIAVAGRSNWDRALDEARAVAAACRSGDAVSVIVAGPSPRAVLPAPSSDRERIAAAIEQAEPPSGRANMLGALNAAVGSLMAGSNPNKQIVVLTDATRTPWQLPAGEPGEPAAERWRFLADNMEQLSPGTRITVRPLDVPAELRNAAVGRVRLGRKIVGTDRPVGIEVDVMNTGSRPLGPGRVRLRVDGREVADAAFAELAGGAAARVPFEHEFVSAGAHVVEASLDGGDDIAGDDQTVRVMEVLDRLGVLIIDGSPSARWLEGGAGDYIDIALSPGPKASGGTEEANTVQHLARPHIVPAPDIASVDDLRSYSVVVLADVPQLPGDFAQRLARFVHEGGGLLICPGQLVSPGFYALWRGPDGGRIAPAELVERKVVAENPASLAISSLTHPGFASASRSDRSDAASVRIEAYWRLAADAEDNNVRVGGLLDTGEPALVERRAGRGRVAMLAFALDGDDSNITNLNCFPPLVHELTYVLCGASLADLNRDAARQLTVEFQLEPSQRRALGNPAVLASGEPAELETPTGRRLPASVRTTRGGVRLSFGATPRPGLYRLHVREPLAGVLSSLRRGGSIPLAVGYDVAESEIDPLTAGDVAWIGKHVPLRAVETIDELTAAVAGEVPGEELWRYLALVALLALVAEVAVGRWITRQRRTHDVEQIEFGARRLDVRAFRTQSAAAKRAAQEAVTK